MKCFGLGDRCPDSARPGFAVRRTISVSSSSTHVYLSPGFSVQKRCFRWECEGYPEIVGMRHDWLQDDE